MRTLLLCLLLFGLGIGSAVLVARPAGAQTQAVDGTLTGSVGTAGSPNSYVISLSADTVPGPGTYEFDITDYASIHNFDLRAPDDTVVDETTIKGTGTVIWTVALSPGVYTFQCDAHSSSMSGILTVPAATTSTSTAATTSTTIPTSTATSTSTPATTGTTDTTSTTTAATSTTTTTTVPTTTVPTTTAGVAPLKVRIASAHGTARSVTLKVSSTTPGQARAELLKGSKRLAKTSHSVPGKLVLKPTRALKPGSYTVKVKVTAGGKSASVKKTVRVG